MTSSGSGAEPGASHPSGSSTSKVTIYEVARRAGVSIATVSHVLNRPERVAAATRTKVLEAVDHFDFVPKAVAVSRARQGVGRIGVIAPFTAYGSYHPRLLGLFDGLAASALELAVFDCRAPVGAASPTLESLPMTGRLDGLIAMGLPVSDEVVERTMRRGLPTVLVDTTHPALDRVLVDDVAGGRLIGEHLVARGDRRIAFVHELPEVVLTQTAGELRMQGCGDALVAASAADATIRHIPVANSLAGGRAAAAEIRGWDERPDCIVAHHDTLAAGVWQGLTSAGWQLPADVGLIGYDGTDLADALGITTVRQPFHRTGMEAADLLLSRLDGYAGPPRTVLLQPAFVPGATS